MRGVMTPLLVSLSHCLLASADVSVLACCTVLGCSLAGAGALDVGDVLVVARTARVGLEEVDVVLVTASANAGGAGRGGWGGVARRFSWRALWCVGGV